MARKGGMDRTGNSRLLIDVTLASILAFSPVAERSCHSGGGDQPQGDWPREVELEYHQQSIEGGRYDAFPYGIGPFVGQLTAEGLSVSIIHDFDIIGAERIAFNRGIALNYVSDYAVTNSNGPVRKRHLFAILGFFDLENEDVPLCGIGGATFYNVVSPSERDYDELWVSFVCCGDSAECFPAGSTTFHKDKIQVSTIHELGHLIAHTIPHCSDQQYFHTPGINQACVMYQGVAYGSPPAFKLQCSDGAPILELTYDFCSACKNEIRWKAPLWPN